MKRVLKIIARTVGLLALLALLLAILFLRSPWGQARLGRAVARALPRAGAFRVDFSGLTGRLPQQGALSVLRISDAAGPWLVASNVTWNLSLADGWHWRPRVHTLEAARVDWLRRPRSEARAASPRGAAAWPALVLEEIRAPDVRIADAVAGTNLAVALTGHLVMASVLQARLEVARSQAPGLLNADVQMRRGGSAVVRLAYREREPGLLAARWPQAGLTSCVVEAEAFGGGVNWTGTVRVTDGAAREVSGRWSARGLTAISADVWCRGVAYPVLRQPVAPSSARLAVSRVESNVAAQFSLQGTWADVPLVAAGRATFSAAGIRCPDLQARTTGLAVRASLSWVRGDLAAEGTADFTNAPLLVALAGVPLAGVGRLELAAARRGGRQHVEATGTVSMLQTPWGEAGRVEGRASWTNGLPAWSGSARVTVTDFARGPLIVSNAVMDATGGATQFAARVSAEGAAGSPLRLAVHVTGERRDAAWTLTADDGTADFAAEHLALTEPVRVVLGPHHMAWERLRVALGEGRLAADGVLGTEEVSVSVALDRFPLAVLGRQRLPVTGGLFSGRLEVGGTRSAPVVEVAMEALEVRLRAPPGFTFAPVDASLRGAFSNRIAQVSLELAGWTEKPVRAGGRLPLEFALDGRVPRLLADQPVEAALAADLEMAGLGSVTDLRGVGLRGALHCELDVRGTVEKPDVHGLVTVRKGAFEFPETGTVIKDVSITLEGDRERLVIREATSTDGAGGTLVLEGHVLFRPDQSFPFEVALVLQRAELWRQGGSRVRLNGRLALAGNVQEMLLSGTLQAVDAEIRLGRPAPRIIVLEVEDPGGRSDARPKGPPSQWRKRVTLDVKAGGRGMVVTGRGLESQWRGDLRATGLAAAPHVDGQIRVERGYFLFMGRRFNLGDATLSLDGRYPPQPEINAVASCRAADMTATLHVSGPVREPKLVLDSDPSYPTDEILSRLLFGKSTDSISALQAVRLAHGLNVLRGKGSTLDVLDRGQSALRVDQLELKQSEGSADLSSVSVGKYIGRSVYVQGEKALGGAEDVISVEFELLPSLILQTESSPGIREGIGLKWRRDY